MCYNVDVNLRGWQVRREIGERPQVLAFATEHDQTRVRVCSTASSPFRMECPPQVLVESVGLVKEERL